MPDLIRAWNLAIFPDAQCHETPCSTITPVTLNLLKNILKFTCTPLGQVKVVCGMLQRRLSRVASDDNPTRALATGGDWTIVTYFRFRAQHRMWNTNNQKLVESDENESKENFHSSPEDVKNFKLNTLNAKWLYLTIFTNWRYVLSAVFLESCNILANFYRLWAVISVRCFLK